MSANSMAKFANGICDNLLTCVFRAWDFKNKPMIVAPAMNTYMYVFIAGATIIGLILKSQALNTQVRRLSQMPLANFAILLADIGATTIN